MDLETDLPMLDLIKQWTLASKRLEVIQQMYPVAMFFGTRVVLRKENSRQGAQYYVTCQLCGEEMNTKSCEGHAYKVHKDVLFDARVKSCIERYRVKT